MLAAATTGFAGCLGGSDEEPRAVETNEVVIPGRWVFEPQVIRVSQGTTVTWINNGGQSHTVTFRNREREFDVELEPGEETRHTFEEPGTYDYYCKFHPPDMVGTVRVTEN